MNLGIIVEVSVNFIQQFMFIGFLYLFFDKETNKVKNVLAFWITVIFLFTVCNYFTFHELTFNHLDSIIGISVMLIYTLVFLKGALYLRVIIPFVVFGVNIAISYLNLHVMAYFGNIPFVDALTFSTAFRYLYVATTNLFFMVTLLVLLRIGKKNIQISDIPEILSFLFISIIIYVAALSDMILYEVSGFNTAVLPYVVIICLSIFVLTGMFWYLLLKISRDNKLKTDLLLSKQREEMYKNSVLSTNEYIEKVSRMKHDMKNNAMAINCLIAEGEYEKAKAICDSLSTKLNVPNMSYCENPVLNAIINVEIDKALHNNIDFSYTITENLSFVDDVDIVSVIGNICDNAIEYLLNVDTEKKHLTLEVSSYKDYSYVTCKNNIISSILKDNPEMKSTKAKSDLHGKGMNILREIAQKYGGDLLVKECKGELTVSAIFQNKK